MLVCACVCVRACVCVVWDGEFHPNPNLISSPTNHMSHPATMPTNFKAIPLLINSWCPIFGCAKLGRRDLLLHKLYNFDIFSLMTWLRNNKKCKFNCITARFVLLDTPLETNCFYLPFSSKHFEFG